MRKQELHPRTEALNKQQKNKSKQAKSNALLWLKTQFPQAFDTSIQIRPLKTGIINDIMEYADKAAQIGISKSKLREAVVLFTRRIDYLTCLKSREIRIDLQGNPVMPVTDEEAESAASKIKKRVEKNAKNIRKINTEKLGALGQVATDQSIDDTKSNANSDLNENYLPTYPLRSIPSSPEQISKTAVIVRHKSTRSFDPSAVARLKEKLGLSRTPLEEKM